MGFPRQYDIDRCDAYTVETESADEDRPCFLFTREDGGSSKTIPRDWTVVVNMLEKSSTVKNILGYSP